MLFIGVIKRGRRHPGNLLSRNRQVEKSSMALSMLVKLFLSRGAALASVDSGKVDRLSIVQFEGLTNTEMRLR